MPAKVQKTPQQERKTIHERIERGKRTLKWDIGTLYFIKFIPSQIPRIDGRIITDALIGTVLPREKSLPKGAP